MLALMQRSTIVRFASPIRSNSTDEPFPYVTSWKIGFLFLSSYLLPTKLRESNIFSRVCLFAHRRRPVQTCSLFRPLPILTSAGYEWLASRWYTSYWNAFLYCNTVYTIKTIFSLRIYSFYLNTFSNKCYWNFSSIVFRHLRLRHISWSYISPVI